MHSLLSFLLAAALCLAPGPAAALTVCICWQREDGVYVDTLLEAASGGDLAFPRAVEFYRVGTTRWKPSTPFFSPGLGDGLPLVPPTPERVEAMLAGYDLPGDVPIATLAALRGGYGEKIAVNAVMAGCLPQHMPVLVAAVEAVSQPEFDCVAWPPLPIPTQCSSSSAVPSWNGSASTPGPTPSDAATGPTPASAGRCT
ncbi:MAG: hypothetical protein V8Q84_04525 [Bilophila sp.]